MALPSGAAEEGVLRRNEAGHYLKANGYFISFICTTSHEGYLFPILCCLA